MSVQNDRVSKKMSRAKVLAQYPRGAAKIGYILDNTIAKIRDDCISKIVDHPTFFLGPLAVLATADVLDRLATDVPKILYYVTVESSADVERLLTKNTFASSLRYAIIFRDPLDEQTIAVYFPETETVRMYEDGIFGNVAFVFHT